MYINSIVLKTILRRCPQVTDKIVIAVVKYIEHPIAFLSELYTVLSLKVPNPAKNF